MAKNDVLKLALVQVAMLGSFAAYAGPQGNEKGNAAPVAPVKTVLEQIVYVGFAPPDMTGQYRLQVQSDGSVVSIDNKGVTKKVAKLNPDDMTGVLKSVEKLTTDAKSNNDQPPCMDAPSTKVKAYRADGSERIILLEQGCREFYSSDDKAYPLAAIVSSLSSVQSSLRQLNSKE